MSKQPEALRLVDVYPYLEGGERGQWIIDAAVELWRLHVENADTREHLKQKLEAFKEVAAERDALLEALERSRAQWIHSVNAEQCLAAIAKAQQ